MIIRALTGIALVAAALSAFVACGGGSDKMTLEEYMRAFDQAGDEADARSNDLNYDNLDSLNTFEERRDSFVQTTEQFRDVFNDFNAKIRALDPPSEVEDIHGEIIDAFNDYDAAFNDVIEQAKATTDEADFEASVDTSKLQDGGRLDELCDRLQKVADDNQIDVDFQCQAA
jgi:hypothetical protein